MGQQRFLSWRRTLFVAAVFAALGPFIGYLLFTGPMGLLLGIMFAGIPLFFAYVMGLPAAAATGLLAAMAARSGKAWFFGLTAVVTGSLLPLVPALVKGQLSENLYLSGVGGGAAAICALITFGLTGLTVSIPSNINSAVKTWEAGSVLLVVLWLVNAILVVSLGAVLLRFENRLE